MDTEYVRESVGSALAIGLAEVALIRPPDPIEYLALWLLKHKRNKIEAHDIAKPKVSRNWLQEDHIARPLVTVHPSLYRLS